MWRRYFGPKFGAGILAVLAACSGEKFGDAPDQIPDGGAGKTGQTPHNPSDQGSFDHGLDGPPVTPEGGASDAGAGGDGVGATANSAGAAGGNAGGDGGTGGDGGAPACQPINEEWTEDLSPLAQWGKAFGNPKVDTANHRLVLGWDDVALHNRDFSGGYYLTAEITVLGTVPLTLYPDAHEGVWPSMRVRNGTLELGGAVYGQDQVWRTTTWPGFSEVQIPGTNSVHATFYVKAKAREAAAKVWFGSDVWRTGWITGLNAPDTNLASFRYVGMNNSGATHLEENSIYVGPVSGCEGLSDAEVQAEFEN